MTIERVTPDEARALLDDRGYVLVDVRTAGEFGAGHPAGAYNIPFLHQQAYGRVANPDFTKVFQTVFPDRSKPILVSCASGGRSARAAQELSTLGYTALRDVRGGFEGERNDAGEVTFPGWSGRGLPVETGDPSGRSYVELYARLTAPPPPPPPAAAHGHHGHAHAAPAPASGDKGSRFADPNRMVDCAKLNQRLPAIKRKPMGGALGQRIFDTISAEAWEQWVEHSKLLINEYRLNPSEPKSQEMLVKQAEQFLFGEGVTAPKEFVPQS